jgi:hypothetical protein
MQGRNEKCTQNFFVSLKGRHPVRDLDTDGKLMLNWILQKMGVRMWTRIHLDKDSVKL